MHAHAGQVLPQYFEVDRFGNAAIASRIVGALGYLEGSIAGDRDNQYMRQMSLLARPMHQRKAVLAAEMNVQKNRFRQRFRGNQYERRLQSVRQYSVKTFLFQPSAQKFPKQGIIFHYKNAMRHRLL